MIVEKAVTSSGTDVLYMDEEEKEVSQTSTRDNLTIIDEQEYQTEKHHSPVTLVSEISEWQSLLK